MQIVKKIIGDKLLVGVEGRIDTDTAAQFGSEIYDEIDDIKNLVIDFSRVEYISSIGLRVILEFYKRMQEQGSMLLINVNPEVKKVFDMTGFSNFLNIQ